MANEMLAASENMNKSVSIFHVLPDCYALIDKYNYDLDKPEIVSIQNFRIKNNTIFSKSWEK